MVTKTSVRQRCLNDTGLYNLLPRLRLPPVDRARILESLDRFRSGDGCRHAPIEQSGRTRVRQSGFA